MIAITRDVKGNEYTREKEGFEFRTHNVPAGSAGIVKHKYTIVTITISSIRKHSGNFSHLRHICVLYFYLPNWLIYIITLVDSFEDKNTPIPLVRPIT
jgi:hypothetical protein